MVNHPFRTSLIFAVTYIALYSIYIWLSVLLQSKSPIRYRAFKILNCIRVLRLSPLPE